MKIKSNWYLNVYSSVNGLVSHASLGMGGKRKFALEDNMKLFNTDCLDRNSVWHGYMPNVIKELNGEHSDEVARFRQNISQFVTFGGEKMGWEFVKHMEEGDIVDVDRVVSGDERCFNSFRRKTCVKPVVRIVINCGHSHRRSKNEISWTGFSAMNIAENIESMGYPVEIYMSSTVRNISGMNDISTVVCIKSSEEYINIGLIGYLTGNDQFYRNIIFADRIITMDEDGKATDYSLGASTCLYRDDLKLIFPDVDEQNLVNVPLIHSMEQAKDFVDGINKEYSNKE